MSRTLVIITANFPFTHNGGEVMFVQPEIARLARTLQARIVVVPMRALGERVGVPVGVDVDTSLSQAWRRGWVGHSLRACSWPGFWREMGRALVRGGPLGAARALRWAAVAQATWDWGRSRFADGSNVVFYSYWRGGATLAAARLARVRGGSAAITRVHGYDLYEERFRPAFQPWWSVYPDLAFSVAVSEHGRDYLLQRSVSPDRVVVSRLGTEAPTALSRGSADGRVRIVSCSMLVPLKRVPMLAHALVRLAQQHPQTGIEWTHFGDGPQMREVRAALSGAPPNLTAELAGSVDNARVIAHYATRPADVFVLLSRAEGLPVAIQEALSAGLPVVATDVGGVREAVGADNGALLSADPSQAEVIAALERIAFNDRPEQVRAMRECSRERWQRHFSAEANHIALARCLDALFDSLETP
ncbi:MAG: glycosyltransferase [Burkholderiaceae bacterium]